METPGSAREALLLGAFVRMADTLVDDYDVVEMLHELVGYCVSLLDSAAAGLVLSDQRGGLQVLASSTDETRLLELFQVQIREGPCLDCIGAGEPVRVPDLAAERARWPRFVPQAVSRGFAAVHAIPMRLRQNTIGALNLFDHGVGAMAEQDLLVARALADIATIGILHERAIRRGEVLTEQLQTALNNRITIEQAKGVLAHAGRLDMHQAFQALRAYGRSRNALVSEVAHQVVTGVITPAAVLTLSAPPGRGST
ncbi:GAF and ANTAR domain-containing protein [Actinokineospora auranticolor]|uniref:ANTAR domain-containing protein n=1 Tax=Actinokineospora auranticolor TaxID=155976 RepID=A0A2S6GJ35_9PSEU|nr:GAF and ANTAR domain-containing protein [Actinokineospora auranticolor]PPK65166.1 ANTAR domain-containing protein [Actinokineospora auranticolor]